MAMTGMEKNGVDSGHTPLLMSKTPAEAPIGKRWREG